MFYVQVFFLSFIGYFKDFSCIVIKMSAVVNFKLNTEKSVSVTMEYGIGLVAVIVYAFITLIFLITAVTVGIVVIVTNVLAVVV